MTDEHDESPPDRSSAEQDTAQQDAQERPRGSMRYQDPETATPREPSMGEKRARRKAEEREEERQRAAAEREEHRQKVRKRVMVGGVATVGIAALVGAWYTSQPEEVTAHCVSQGNQVSDNENYCDRGYVESHGGYINPAGIIFMPIPGGGGFRQYHYQYGGTVNNGRVSGGSQVKPNGARINTPGGKVVQRGGFGGGKGGFGGGKVGA